jgi:putative PIN family toxin of toxin-antitoxin system
MAIPRIVIDTNVLVSALRTKRGASYRLIQQCGRGRFEHVLSMTLAFEYEASCRVCIADQTEAETFLSTLIDSAVLAFADIPFRPYLPDPKDEMVLEAAVNGHASRIVTFNRRHFVGSARVGIRVTDPGEFLTSIGL